MKNKIFVMLTFIILAALAFTVFVENTFLVDVHAAVNQAVFRVSGEEQVVVGRQGRLFFAEELPAYFGGNADDAAIDELVGTVERLNDTLAEHGVRLIVMIAPNKSSVYPEYMAYNLIKGAEHTAGIINERLAERGVDRLNAFALLSGRNEIVYHKTDTHWNAIGALLVYRELMSMLDVPHETYDSQDAQWQTVSAVGDLTKLYRPTVRSAEEDYAPIVARSYRSARPVTNLDAADIRTTCGANNLNMLVVRDSFGEALFPYIANNVGSLTYLRAVPRDSALILAQDVIVIEIVERNVFDLIGICEDILRAVPR
ncbi:MAG: hypothetical protein LBD16_02180 [Oscillospiraceae bacterium]|nr:hypothetical protein [Oscillospiraceae bacterium]